MVTQAPPFKSIAIAVGFALSCVGLLLFLLPPGLLLMLVGQNVLATGVTIAGPRLMGAELVFILLYAVLVFVAVRIAALLVPVVVAGDKTPLIRSWTLSATPARCWACPASIRAWGMRTASSPTS